jgi:hypothetical protein
MSMSATAQYLHEQELTFMRTNPHHRFFHRKSMIRVLRDRFGNVVRRTISDEIPRLYPAPFAAVKKPGARRK